MLIWVVIAVPCHVESSVIGKFRPDWDQMYLVRLNLRIVDIFASHETLLSNKVSCEAKIWR